MYTPPMDLGTWCDQRGHGSKTQVSRDARVSPATVTRLCKGGRMKSYAVAKKISAATCGAVTVAELWEDPMAAERAT